MKRTLLFCFFVLLACTTFGQWADVGGSVDSSSSSGREPRALIVHPQENLLYLGGMLNTVGDKKNIKGIASWNGTAWNYVGNGLICCNTDTGAGYIRALAIFKGELYAAGEIYNLVSDSFKVKTPLAKWDGTKWKPVTNNLLVKNPLNHNYQAGNIQGLYADSANLYILGGFDQVEGVQANNIARFDGVNWYNVAPPIDTLTGGGGGLNVAISYKGELYVGGAFNDPQRKITSLARWNGSQWRPVDYSLGGNSYVQAMTVYKGDLYVGGILDKGEGDPGNGIGRWNGNSWIDLGDGIPYGQITCLKVFNNELYIGGAFDRINGIPANFIAKWDGTKMTAIGGNLDNRVTAMEVYKSELYVAGGFWHVNGKRVDCIAKYKPLINKIEPVNLSVGISVFPNPSSGNISFQASGLIGGALIEVFSILGERVHMEQVSEINTLKEVNLKNTPKGLYILRLTYKDGVLTKQIVIE